MLHQHQLSLSQRHSNNDTTTGIISSHSIFYHISKASCCTFWDVQNEIPDSNTTCRMGMLSSQQQQKQESPIITGLDCCCSCRKLYDIIIRAVQQKLYSTSESFQNAFHSCESGLKQQQQQQQQQKQNFLTSQITGGTVLHALLQSYNTHCPSLIYMFLTDDYASVIQPSPGISFHDYNCQHSWMLLHRDRSGNLPIHFAVSEFSGASTIISDQLLHLLLRQTLLAQQQRIVPLNSINDVGSHESQCYKRCHCSMIITDSSCDYFPPYILSRNQYGRTILDIMIGQYILTGHGNADHKFQSRQHCFRELDYERYRKIVRQLVDQIIQCEKSVYNVIHNQFLQRITIIICAAYRELLLLQRCCQNCRCKYASIEKSSENEFYPVLMGNEDDIYSLHYASALSGLINIFIVNNNNNKSQARCFDVAALPKMGMGRPSPSLRKLYLMQVERPILDLLLYHWGEDVLRLPHSITGRVPLHYAVQSQCSIHCGGDPNISSGKHYEDSMLDNKIDGWLEWIRTLLHIYPEACILKDQHGYIPLHYAILQTCNDCDCRSVFKTNERCRAISLSRFRLIHALILAYPPSIDVPCRIQSHRCTSVGHLCSSSHLLPRMCSGMDYAVEEKDTMTGSQYSLEMFQIAAMIYHPPYSDNFDMLLTIIYTLLRMSPSRLLVFDN